METRTLVSFDIDGTLETGDPAGPLRLAFVRWAQAQGYVIGSCSDRTLGEQPVMWERAGIVPDFVSRKHELAGVRAAFGCRRFVHIGDTHVDRHFAERADFEFIFVLDLARRLAGSSARRGSRPPAARGPATRTARRAPSPPPAAGSGPRADPRRR